MTDSTLFFFCSFTTYTFEEEVSTRERHGKGPLMRVAQLTRAAASEAEISAGASANHGGELHSIALTSREQKLSVVIFF